MDLVQLLKRMSLGRLLGIAKPIPGRLRAPAGATSPPFGEGLLGLTFLETGHVELQTRPPAGLLYRQVKCWRWTRYPPTIWSHEDEEQLLFTDTWSVGRVEVISDLDCGRSPLRLEASKLRLAPRIWPVNLQAGLAILRAAGRQDLNYDPLSRYYFEIVSAHEGDLAWVHRNRAELLTVKVQSR